MDSESINLPISKFTVNPLTVQQYSLYLMIAIVGAGAQYHQRTYINIVRLEAAMLLEGGRTKYYALLNEYPPG